jgi:hypothetical protein
LIAKHSTETAHGTGFSRTEVIASIQSFISATSGKPSEKQNNPVTLAVKMHTD